MEQDREVQRLEMVERQIRRRGVSDPRVLRAMEMVPRHWFVPPEVRTRAYDDSALPIGMGQTISQPYIVALMTELLQVLPEHRVLEVGTGSGYQTMILATLAREVFTIEVQISLGNTAFKLLTDHGVTNVQFAVRNGHFGLPEAAPFDRIMVTAGAESIPPALIDQLVLGGRMVIPIGPTDQDQMLELVLKAQDGRTTVRDISPVRFVPLVE